VEPNEGTRIRELTESVRSNQSALAEGIRRRLLRFGLASDRADVEDVLSEAYLTAAVRLRRDQALQIKSPSGWVSRIALFLIMRRAKKRKVEGWKTLIEDLEVQDAVIDLVHRAEGEANPELRLYVRELLATLEPREREILERTAEGWTAEEIGIQIALTPANVRQVRSRAARRLRQRFHREQER